MIRKDRLNDKFLTDSETYAHLRALDPEMPDHVWQVILRYQPNLPAAQWQAVREFTITMAVQMRPRTFETVRRLMTMTARFNCWVWLTSGCELTVPRVYSNNNAYLFLQEQLRKHSDGHRWGVIRQLGAVADTLANASITPLPSLHRNESRRPFTMSEVAVMHSWAQTRSTEFKRRCGWAILGLAGGAGLRTEEIIDVRIGDIEITDGRLFVNIPGKHPRRVPVRYPWNRTLLRSIEDRNDPEEFVFPGFRDQEYRPRAIQIFLTDNPSRVRATVSRLRASWIIDQIDNRLPLPVLMYITGVATASTLDKYLVHTQPVDTADYVGVLTGEEVA